jgi:hypothetical protein
MDATHFDRIARLFAARRLPRRQALAQGGTGLAAGALAAAGLGGATAHAQEATPAAGVPKGEHDPSFLFVQSFQSGTLAPKAGGGDAFTLTLDHGLGQTVYFSDRPERVFGATPTAQFLQTFPFGENNPPNAALVLEAAPGDTDVIVMELTNPAYDEATHTATYAAKLLADYEKLGITFQEKPKGAAEVHPQFGAASLFIDDCPDGLLCCIVPGGATSCIRPVGACWNWGSACCQPCTGGMDANYWEQQCAQRGWCGEAGCQVSWELDAVIAPNACSF